MKSPKFFRLFIDRSLFVFCFSLCHLFFFKSNAQTYPPNQHIHDVQWETYQVPQNTPKYLVPFKEPIMGNKVTRISDIDVFGCDCSELRHRYSKNQPWNADGSKIMTDGSRAKILDGNTYKILGTVTPRALWSNNDPDITFDAGGNKFYRKNIVTNKETVLHTFSGYQSVGVGYNEGNLSNDDRWVALIAKNGKDQTILVYDILNDVIVGNKFIGTTSIDWATVSQSGQFVVIRYFQNGAGKNQGVKSYNRQMQNEVHLLNLGAHADIGYDMAGNEVYVSMARYQGYSLSYTRLDNGFTQGLWRSAWRPGDRGVSGGHVSTRNLKRPGWAYISPDHQARDPLVYDAPKEIFAIRLDGSETIERFAKHNTKFDGAKSEYNHQSQAVPNRDGTKVLFASNWHNSQWMKNKYPMMWVVEADHNSTKITANAGIDAVICEGTSITLSATGGYTYLWSTGAKTASIKVSPEKTATYKVTAYDSSGKNSDTDEVKVSVNPLPKVDAGPDVSIKVGETVTLTANGASSYKWSTGATTSSINVSPTSTETYTVTGTKNNCEASDSITVFSVEASVKANAGEDTDLCKGSSTTLNATGGSTYLWSTGARTASITVSPNKTTTYTVTAFDSTGKNSDKDDVIVEVNATPIVSAGNNITINSGESTNLTATGASTYKWNTGATSSSITVSPTATKTYTVTGTKNGCESTSTVKVTVLNTVEVVADAGVDQSICAGSSTNLTATGGSTYLWDTGATTASIDVDPNETTTYTVTAYDTTGKNSDTDQVTVTVNPLPTVSAGNNITINLGESPTLTATGASTYKWNTGATSASITVSPTATKTYTVTGTKNGCESTSTVKVSVLNTVEVVADAGVDQSICAGSSTNLTATGGSTYLWDTGATTASIDVDPNETTTYAVTAYDTTGKNSDTDQVTVTVNSLPTVSAGNNITINLGESPTLTATGASTYKWSTGGTGESITVRPTATKTYTVTGTKNGCESTNTVKVTVLNTVEVSANAGEDQSICAGSSTTLTATGGSTYLWDTGATTASIDVDPNETTTYTVTAYDTTGKNSDTDQVTVTVNSLPTVSAGNNITINSGEGTTLTATGAATYKWSTGAKGQSITVSPTATKTYTVTGTKNGCESTSTVKVTVLNTVGDVADAGVDQSICAGSSTTLTATGGSTYLWDTGAITASIDVDPNETTTYTVTAYDTTGKNSDTDQVTVTVNPLPKVSAGNNITINSGESATLTATGASSYKWNTGATSASITVSPTATKTYTVTGKGNGNGCEATDTVKVIVLNTVEVIADAGADQSICAGSSTTLTASGGSTYLWNTGATTASINITPNKTATYTVTAYDSTGKYSDTDKVTVTVNSIPVVDAGKNVTINLGESTTLTATGAGTYKWNTDATSASITVSPTATRTYKVTGTKNGCEATSTVKVTVVNPSKVIAHGGGNKEVCEGSTVTLTATGGDTYLWSTGAKTASISVNPKSTTKYSVTAYIGNASDTDEVVVNVNPTPNVAIKNGAEAAILEGEFITLSATGAKTYNWSNGATQPNIAVRPNITKTYNVTGHVNKCSSRKSVKVNVFEKVVASAGSDVTIKRNEKTVLTATGPKNSEYLWSTGESTKSITVGPNEDTEYSVMVYHDLDSDTANVTVKVIDIENQIIEDSVDLEFLVYPNPTDGELNIKISGLTNLSSIHLYDLSGKSLYNEIINESDRNSYIKTLNLSDYASGIYLLQLVDNQRVITKKVVLR